MTASLYRRAALGALASTAALGLPAAAGLAQDASSRSCLSLLIAAHRQASDDFGRAIDDREAAEPTADDCDAGLAGAEYLFKNGKERIGRVDAGPLRSACVRPQSDRGNRHKRSGRGLQAVAIERDALARLDFAFATADAARKRWDEAKAAEMLALDAI